MIRLAMIGCAVLLTAVAAHPITGPEKQPHVNASPQLVAAAVMPAPEVVQASLVVLQSASSSTVSAPADAAVASDTAQVADPSFYKRHRIVVNTFAFIVLLVAVVGLVRRKTNDSGGGSGTGFGGGHPNRPAGVT